MSGWRTQAMESLRTSGRAFYCFDPPTVPPGYYRFAAPTDDEPRGPFASRLEAHREAFALSATTIPPNPPRASGARKNGHTGDFKRGRR